MITRNEYLFISACLHFWARAAHFGKEHAGMTTVSGSVFLRCPRCSMIHVSQKNGFSSAALPVARAESNNLGESLRTNTLARRFSQ